MSSQTYVPSRVDLKAKKKIHISFGKIMLYFFMLLMLCFMIIPLVYVFLTSLKPLDELLKYPPPIFVKNPTFQNYKDMVTAFSSTTVPFLRYVFNSLFTTLSITVASVFISTLAGYSLVKLRVKAANTIFNIVVAAMMFVMSATTIMNYLIVNEMGLIDTYWALIIPKIAVPTYVFLVKQFAEQIPNSLLEAARIDGATEMRTFIRIAMPMMKPALVTVFMFAFNANWSDSVTSLYYVTDEAKRTLPLAITTLSTAGGLARTGATAAISAIMIIPSIIVLILSQSQVQKTMAHSGIKA